MFDQLLKGSVGKNIIKSFLPMIQDKIKDLEAAIHEALQKIELREGETHATWLMDFDNNETYLVLAVFSEKTFSRAVNTIKLSDFIKDLISNVDKL